MLRTLSLWERVAARFFGARRGEGPSGEGVPDKSAPSPQPSPMRACECGKRAAARGEREPTAFAAPVIIIADPHDSMRPKHALTLLHLDADFAEGADLEAIAWPDQRCGTVFLDERGAFRLEAWSKRRAIEDLGIHCAAGFAEID